MRLVQSALQDWIIGIALRRVSRTGSQRLRAGILGRQLRFAFEVPKRSEDPSTCLTDYDIRF